MLQRILACLLVAVPLFAQAPAPPRPVASPEVAEDRRVTFRLVAAKAEEVRLISSDIPNNAKGLAMTKDAAGVWQVTTEPLPPGAYRYHFSMGGVSFLDPRNPQVSESNNNAWSMVVVPGSPVFDTREVPHGAVAEVTYQSATLGRHRRMHVYTPPGYELGKQKYPVFYLLHGAGDCDDSWSTVGRAGFILDNLIADGKAKPMIVVMPAGHTSTGGFRMPSPADEFTRDFIGDILPYVEKHYRVLPNRANRAIAGLSMGGNQTLNIAFRDLNRFAYIGVFSSGLFGQFPTSRPGAPPAPAPKGPSWEEEHKAQLQDPALKKGLRLFWIGCGKEDFLVKTHQQTAEFFKQHGFNVTVRDTEGAHTWMVWREYLSEFAPLLFR